MKRLFAIVLFAMPLLASESFTLTIPKRFDASQEIGEVRIRLSLSANPAGAQLVVGGAATINLGATQTVAGDSIAFESLPNNRVMIRYRPLSNFSGDFCSGANAADKNIALRFSGAQDVVDYRMSSFVVGAPAVECSDVARRIADMPATIAPNADGVAPALNATDLGRLPIDVVLVLDKSGSINDVPPGADPTSTTTKLMIVKAAAQAFIANWREIDAPFDGFNWAEDRIGLVFFDDAAAPRFLPGADPPGNFFIQRGSSAVPGPWDPIINATQTFMPGGSTSIGAGINSAMEQWKFDPAHDLHVVVVTDGMQNTAPLIAATSSGFLGLAPISGLPQELRKRFIPIQTIGFGTPAAVDEDLLRNISLETAGRSYIGIDSATMYDVFAMTLVSILKGNTASVAVRQRGTVVSAPGKIAPNRVEVDKSARRVVFSVQWDPPARNALVFDVFRPNQSTPATPTRTERVRQAMLQTFDLGGKNDIGSWTVRVKRNPKQRDQWSDVPYTLNVFFLEKDLDYRISVTPERATLGQPMQLRAELSYDGKPLTGLPADAIRVRVLRPKSSLADVLRRNAKLRPRVMKNGDTQTAQQGILRALPASAIAELRPAEAERLTLREEKRGMYSIPIAKGTIAGSYAFEVVLDWTDPRTGRVHREERVEAFVGEKR
jgi:hypothetical protein